jgi:hypothetical protein
MRLPLWTASACFFAGILSGCAGAPAADAESGQRVVVNNTVVVSFTEAQERLPFNPRAARLQEATEQMTKIAGHAIELRFDAALLPEFRASFEEALTNGVENIARDLSDAKEREPRIFAYGAPLLKRVFCKYDAVVTEDDAKIDVKTGEVTITMPVRSTTLIPRGAIHAVMEDAFDDELDRRFSNVEPEQADDLDSYFDYLTASRHARHEHRADLTTKEGLANDPYALTLDRIARLSLRAPHDGVAKSLHTRIENHLVDAVSYFIQAYDNAPVEVQRAPQNTAFHRAEASYVAWLNRDVDLLAPNAHAEILKSTAVLPFNRDRHPGDGTFVSFAFPGFDWMGAALRVVDAWTLAGHPIGTASPRELQRLFDEIVCPYPRDENGARTESPRCDHELYEYAFAMNATARAKFISYLLAKKDALLTEMTFVNLLRLRGQNTTGGVINAWRAIESDASQWNVAATVIGEELASSGGDARQLIDESGRIWRAYPQRRGAALFVLSEVDQYGNGAVDWPRFPGSFGAPISQSEFTSYLDQNFRGISNAFVMWPALGKFSRADVIVPRLDKYIDDPRVRRNNFQDPERAIGRIVNALCDEGSIADLAKIHGYFQSRIAFHAGDSQRFSSILTATRDDKCKPKPKARVSKKSDTPDPFAPSQVDDDPGQPFGPPGAN